MSARVIVIMAAGLIFTGSALAACGAPGPSVASAQRRPASGGSPAGLPHVEGNQLLDGSGHPLVMRGAHIETSFAYIKDYQRGKNPLDHLNTKAFDAMAAWGMNTVRINVSSHEWDLADYQSRLDTAVRQANDAGLYVVIDFHNDAQSGCTSDCGKLHRGDLGWWAAVASRYKDDPRVMFDLVNEPTYPGWQEWRNGMGGDLVGVQAGIDAIRGADARQVIVLEPGTAGRTSDPRLSGWNGSGPFLPGDPDLVYSLHEYQDVINGDPRSWTARWGDVWGKHPLFYGEWAVLPHALHPSECKNLTSANAAQVTTAFLGYMAGNGIGWTAWSFSATELIVDEASYQPTTFRPADGRSWSCDSPNAIELGMGEVVKGFLQQHPAS